MNQKWKRYLSLALAMIMVFSMIPATAVRAAEADGWYWDNETTKNVLLIKDGSIIGSNLYTAIQNKLKVNASNSESLYYDTKNNGSTQTSWNASTTKTTVTNDNNVFTLNHDVTYYLASFFLRSVTTGSITVKHYYSLTTAVAADSPAGAGITLSKSSVVKGECVEISVAEVMGYDAVVTDHDGNAITNLAEYYPTTSTTLTVEYIPKATTFYSVTLDVRNGEYGAAELLDTEAAAGDIVHIKAEPISSTPNASYFIESIKVGETDLSKDSSGNYAYTMTASNAEVIITFGAKILNAKPSANIAYNFGLSTTNQLDALKQAIFSQLAVSYFPETDNFDWNHVSFSYYPYFEEAGSGNFAKDSLPLGDPAPDDGTDHTYFDFGARGASKSEKIRISYNNLYIDAEVQLTEGRSQAPMSIVDTELTCDSTEGDAIIAFVRENNLVTYPKDNADCVVSYMLISSDLEAQTATVKVEYMADGYYTGNSREITVKLSDKAFPAQVTLTAVGGGNVTLATNELWYVANSTKEGRLEESDYILTATPADLKGSDGYVNYIERIAVSKDGGEAITLKGYSAAAVTSTLDIDGNHSYVITVTFGEKKLDVNANSQDAPLSVFYNPAVSPAHQMKGGECFANGKDLLLEQAIFNAAVNAGASIPIGLTWEDLTYAYYPWQIITLNGNEYACEFDPTAYSLNVSLPDDIPEDTTLRSHYPFDFGERFEDNGVEKIKLTWASAGSATVSQDVYITLVDGRPYADIQISGICNADTLAQVLAYAEDNAVLDSSLRASFALAEGAVLPGEGQDGTVAVIVTVEGSATHRKTVKTININVHNNAYLSPIIFKNGTGYTIAVKQGGRVIDSGSKVESGEYTVTVTPAEGGYYICDLTINGVKAAGRYSNYAYGYTFTVENGETQEVSYTIEASAIKREVVGREKASYSVKLEDGMELADLKQAIIAEVLDLENSVFAPADKTAYMLTGVDTLEEKDYAITITFPGIDGQYPTVSKDFTVTIAKDKTDVSVNPISITVTDSMAEVPGLVKAEILKTFTHLKDNDVSVVFSDPNPVAQGQTKDYTVSVTIAETSTTRKFEGNIKVTVTGHVYDARVTITVNDGGSATYNAETKTMTIIPAAGNFATVQVNDEEPYEITEKSTSSFPNGNGMALGIQPEYAVSVIFAPFPPAHIPGDAVKENVKDASCTAKGSYDMVVYCGNCGTELSRETFPTETLDHKDADNDGDHSCDSCGKEAITSCDDADDDNACDECGNVICEHEDKDPADHNCDLCGKPISSCTDAENDGNHSCDICGKENITSCDDADGDNACGECGNVICEHEDKDPADHNCDLCGKPVSSCTDAENDGNHSCDICGKENITSCDDADGDNACDECGNVICEHEDEDPADHNCDLCGTELSECKDIDKDHKCDICDTETSKCIDEDKDHTCDLCSIKLSDCADADEDGKCDVCGEDLAPDVEDDSADIIRIFGENRFYTALKIADEMKAALGISRFNTIIIASGKTFPDALTGSYLANAKNAPILLAYKHEQNVLTTDYVKENLAEGGKVYLLGGTAAVPAEVEELLEGYDVVRLGGKDRFETNLMILKEAGVTAGQEIMVCTATNFPDSLSASATGNPILLVWNEKKALRTEQKEFLASMDDVRFRVVGGTSAVCEALESELAEYGTIDRLAGSNRFETSVMLAQSYFADADDAVVAYAKNFPDALCGGPLAYIKDAPLILSMGKYEADATDFISGKIHKGSVLGGDILISDESVCLIFGVADHEIITIR